MSLLLPLGLLQLQVLHPQFATTSTPVSHFVAQPQYVYHSPSVYAEHELIQRHHEPSLEVEGRYTSPRVFFDDDSLDESREIRLEEQLREERLRQLQTPLGPPVREVRRYEKSVEGDLDYSEDKKIKLSRKRRNADVVTAPETVSEEIEERRRFQPVYGNSGASNGHGRPQIANQQQIPRPQRGQIEFHNQRPASQQLSFQNTAPSSGGNRGQRLVQQRPNPNYVLKGQGLYGAYKGTFGGQKQKASGR